MLLLAALLRSAAAPGPIFSSYYNHFIFFPVAVFPEENRLIRFIDWMEFSFSKNQSLVYAHSEMYICFLFTEDDFEIHMVELAGMEQREMIFTLKKSQLKSIDCLIIILLLFFITFLMLQIYFFFYVVFQFGVKNQFHTFIESILDIT